MQLYVYIDWFHINEMMHGPFRPRDTLEVIVYLLRKIIIGGRNEIATISERDIKNIKMDNSRIGRYTNLRSFVCI